MLVSTFELLVKPIAPAGSGPSVVARTVVQGYFLTIANTSDTNLTLQVSFTVTTPSLSASNTAFILDVTGANSFGDVSNSLGSKRSFAFVRIPAHDTALVTLLPDLTNPQVLASKTLEVRGYVDISLTSPFSFAPFDLLLTPEHRGTFLPENLTAAIPDFDQLVYALPTATGSSLFKVSSSIGFPGPPVPPTPTPPIPTGLDQMLNQMAQRIEGLENRLQVDSQLSLSTEDGSVVSR